MARTKKIIETEVIDELDEFGDLEAWSDEIEPETAPEKTLTELDLWLDGTIENMQSMNPIEKSMLIRGVELLKLSSVSEFRQILLAMGKPGFEKEGSQNQTDLERYATKILNLGE